MATPDPLPPVEPDPDSDDPAPAPRDPPAPERRRTLETIVAIGSAAYACALLAPSARMLASSGEGSGGQAKWLRVIRLDSLPEGEPTRVQVKGDQRDAFTVTPQITLGSVWLKRRGSEVVALSAECPHLGCAIDLTGDSKSFACPCHTSRFALDGKAESGPSPRDMDPIATRVTDGWVEVDLRRYRQGAQERVEVGT
jgi:cytochrome b6-f complex iron-sulfur subunit/menaquinol-cytochrome c reductase iron-sulfur subunit